jgi:hypothetical protein
MKRQKERRRKSRPPLFTWNGDNSTGPQQPFPTRQGSSLIAEEALLFAICALFCLSIAHINGCSTLLVAALALLPHLCAPLDFAPPLPSTSQSPFPFLPNHTQLRPLGCVKA